MIYFHINNYYLHVALFHTKSALTQTAYIKKNVTVFIQKNLTYGYTSSTSAAHIWNPSNLLKLVKILDLPSVSWWMTSILQYIEIPFPSERILASVSDSVEKVKNNQMIMPLLYLKHVIICRSTFCRQCDTHLQY